MDEKQEKQSHSLIQKIIPKVANTSFSIFIIPLHECLRVITICSIPRKLFKQRKVSSHASFYYSRGGGTCTAAVGGDGGGSLRALVRSPFPGAGECRRCRWAGDAMMFARFPPTTLFLAKAEITMNSGGGGVGRIVMF